MGDRMIAETEPSATHGAAAPELAADIPSRPQPATIEETGLELSMLADLMLKTIHFAGRPNGKYLADQLALSFPATEELLTFLRQGQAIEVVGTSGVGERGYQYALTDRGQKKADEAMARSQYVGPAPIPMSLYVETLREQSVSNIRIGRDAMKTNLSHLVLSDEVLAGLGPAVNSAKSLLIYGNSGNGKSSVTMAIGQMLPGTVLIPYAVEVHGQIVKVFDPRIHREIAEDVIGQRRRNAADTPFTGPERRRDRRWAVAARPVISVGGELTLQDMELRYSPLSRFYIAPLQWKANSGVLIIDDFGRQMIEPQALLNRWIVPMEQGIDHLSFHTGDMVEVPFDTLLIFSSNIPPGQLGDEAFFRRICHKVEMLDPTLDEYLEILRRVCAEHNMEYTEEGADYLISKHYKETGRQFRACHPRDLIALVSDIACYLEEEPALRREWLDMACGSYFVDVPEAP